MNLDLGVGIGQGGDGDERTAWEIVAEYFLAELREAIAIDAKFALARAQLALLSSFGVTLSLVEDAAGAETQEPTRSGFSEKNFDQAQTPGGCLEARCSIFSR